MSQEKKSDLPDFPSDSLQRRSIASSVKNQSPHPESEAVHCRREKLLEGKTTQGDHPSEQIQPHCRVTAVTPSLQRNYNHVQITDPASSLQQNEPHSQTIEAIPLPHRHTPNQIEETTPTLQKNDFEDHDTLVDGPGYVAAVAAENGSKTGISDDTHLSSPGQPGDVNTVVLAETTLDQPRTISRQDRSTMAIARVQVAIRALGEEREALLGMRVKVQETRNSARQKRSALADLNAQILEDIQRKAALRPSNNSVPSPELWVKLQESLEELQVSEAELSGTEDLLNRKEWELKEAELAVYQSSDFEGVDASAADSTSFVEELIAETASDGTLSVQPARTPLEKQYLSRKGDAEMIAEELDELRAYRAHLVDEDRARQALGMSLNAEAQRFLENFDVRHNQLQQDLFYTEEDIFRLQTMLSNTQDDALYTANHFDLSQADDSLLTDCRDAPDPLLLNKEVPSPGFSNLPSDISQNSLSTVDYINEWLLHRLRRSPLEILLFRSELQGVHLDSEQLKDLVLKTWPRDDMSKVYSEARRRSRRSFSYNARSHRPNLSIEVARSDSGIYHVSRFGHASPRGYQMTSRNRSSVTLALLNNRTLYGPSTASSV